MDGYHLMDETDELLTLLLRVIIQVPLVTPTELHAKVPVIPEHLALPITAGGVGLTLMVARDHASGKSRLGPLFTIPALESYLTNATSDRPQIVETARQLALLAGWTPPVVAPGTGGQQRWKRLSKTLPQRADTDPDGAVRAIAVVAGYLASQRLMLVFHTDRSPAGRGADGE